MLTTKKLAALVCTAAMLCSLAACNNNGNESGNGTADTTAEQTTTEEADVTTASNGEDDETVYILGENVTDKMVEISQLNVGNRVRLANVIKKAQNGEDITVAYIGGSITQGSSAGNALCYANLTTEWLQKKFPDITVNYVNAGIGATGSFIGVHRADADVLAKNPDLVFVEFAVNDTTENTERNTDSYDSLLRKLWSADCAPAIITIMMTMEDGTSFQEYHAAIAKSYDLPIISYKNAIEHVINEKNFIKWDDISDDNIHPNVPGHLILSQLLTSYIQQTIDDLDSITGDESDFSTAYTDDIYSEATLLSPSDITPDTISGLFQLREEGFGNFNGFWRAVTADGDFKDSKLSFTVEAKRIGIFYGEIVGRGAKFDVYVDGEFIKTIDSNFPDGWGSYVEAVEIINYEEKGTHSIDIVPQAATGPAYVNISRIAIA